LAKQEKLTSNSLANQLGKNRNLAKIETWQNSPPTRKYTLADPGWHRVPKPSGRVKKEIKNRE
jgi:hypothetical protein